MTAFRRLIELPKQFGHLFRKRLPQDVSKIQLQRGAYASSNRIQLGIGIRSARHADPHLGPWLLDQNAYAYSFDHHHTLQMWQWLKVEFVSILSLIVDEKKRMICSVIVFRNCSIQ
jgi:hypothetical protein